MSKFSGRPGRELAGLMLLLAGCLWLVGCGKKDAGGDAGGEAGAAASSGEASEAPASGGESTDPPSGGAPSAGGAPPPGGVAPMAPPMGGPGMSPMGPGAPGASAGATTPVPAAAAPAGPRQGPVHPVRSDPFAPLDEPNEPAPEEETDAAAVPLLPIRANITFPPDDEEEGDEEEVAILPVITTGVVWGAVTKAILQFPEAGGGQPRSQVVRLNDRVTVNLLGERELIVQRIQQSGVTLRDPVSGREYFAPRGEG